MKIVTVNIPELYIEAIEKLIGKNGLYPSRSELIRVAVREFLLKELKMAKNMANYTEPELESFDDKNFIKLPIEKKPRIHEYECPNCHKTYLMERENTYYCTDCKKIGKNIRLRGNGSQEPVREFKTVKILRRLE